MSDIRLGHQADHPFLIQPRGCDYTPEEVGSMLGNRVIQPHYAAWLVRKAIAQATDTLREEMEALTRENRILTVKSSGTLANNLCPDHRDKQSGKPCLACEIESMTNRAEKAESALAECREAASKGDPIETIQCWADAYSNPTSTHFMGHGAVASLLREYADLRAAIDAARAK